MTTLLVSDTVINDPLNLIPFLEKDPAIIRGKTKGMLDFSNPATYAAAGAIPAGAKLHDLVSGGVDAEAISGLPAIVNGMMVFDGTGPTNRGLKLGSNFRLPNTCKKALSIVYIKALETGWGAQSTITYPMLFGLFDGSSAPYHWAVYLSVNTAGTVSAMFCAGAGTQAAIPGPNRAAILNGTVKQIATLWEVNDAGTLQRATAIVDGVEIVNSGWVAYAGFPNPTSNPTIGYDHAPFCAPWNNTAIGRPSLVDLTGSTKTVAEVLAADAAAVAGYIS